jgi:hypothetical protein
MTTAKRKWTASEVQKLLTMAKNGVGRAEIAFALNRSIASVQVKAFWLNISVRRARRAPWRGYAAFTAPAPETPPPAMSTKSSPASRRATASRCS